MSEDWVNWETLVKRARSESAPSLDVTDRVARRLARTSTPRVSDWPVWSAAGLSVAAALLMMVTVDQLGISFEDPIDNWLSSLLLVIS